MAKHQDDPANWPPLGRVISWVDLPGSATKITVGLVIACAFVMIAQLTFEAHPHMEAEGVFGFYAVYGFIMFTALIFAAKMLRYFIKRPENYYAPHVIDTEEYPEEELGRETVDG